MPRSRRVMLPDSGHAALLERGMDLAAIMRGAGVTAKPRHRKHTHTPAAPYEQPAVLTDGQQAAAASPPATAGAAGTETVRVRLADSSKKKFKNSVPRIIGVVKDDKALPGSRGSDGVPPPRPATVLPRNPTVATPAAAGAAAVDSSSSSTEVPRYTPVAAAGAAAAMAAATAGTGGGAATAAADAGNGSSLAAVAGNNGNGNASKSTSPSQQQEQPSNKVSDADKDLAWDEWSQILAPWRVRHTQHCFWTTANI